MAINAGPSIVTNGLVLSLDAANRKSYPTTGNTWTNLSNTVGGLTQGLLINGSTYNSSNLGSILFDGIDDYCTFHAPNLTTTATVEMWAKVNSGWTGGNGKMFFGWLQYNVWTGTSIFAGSIGFNTASGDVYGINNTTVSSLNLTNNWAHYVFVMRSDVSYTNNKIYINSISYPLSQVNSTENTVARNFNSGNGRIAIWGSDLNYFIPMNCSIFKVYNTELNAQEVQQNFNALRGRFGI